MADRTKPLPAQIRRDPTRGKEQAKAERRLDGAYAGDKPRSSEASGILRELAEQQRHLD